MHLLPSAVADAKNGRGQADTGGFDLFHKARAQTGGAQPSNHFAVFIADLFKDEKVGEGDDFTFHAGEKRWPG